MQGCTIALTARRNCDKNYSVLFRNAFFDELFDSFDLPLGRVLDQPCVFPIRKADTAKDKDMLTGKVHEENVRAVWVLYIHHNNVPRKCLDLGVLR